MQFCCFCNFMECYYCLSSIWVIFIIYSSFFLLPRWAQGKRVSSLSVYCSNSSSRLFRVLFQSGSSPWSNPISQQNLFHLVMIFFTVSTTHTSCNTLLVSSYFLNHFPPFLSYFQIMTCSPSSPE